MDRIGEASPVILALSHDTLAILASPVARHLAPDAEVVAPAIDGESGQ